MSNALQTIIDALKEAVEFLDNGTPIRQGSDVAHELHVALDAARRLADPVGTANRHAALLQAEYDRIAMLP